MPGESGQIVFQDGVNGTTLAAMTYSAIPGVQFIRRHHLNIRQNRTVLVGRQIQELATLFGKTRRA